ncbi:MAG TPA: endonuclease/exonuclease/phosphatase family protein [Thermoanaerobaculia bacterium]|nr:endonuclease/exonuclease/phosphatase family protein [Thermoanaerobaculia bacterium]
MIDVSPDRLEQRTVPLATPPATLRMVSYNIQGQGALYGSLHLERIAGVLRKNDADVVALQEVHRSTWRSRFRDQASELADATGMNLAFSASTRLGRGQYGNALLTRGEILHSVTHVLPGRGEPRSMLEALVDLDGGVFSAYVTHLSAWGRLARATRLRQTARVARLVRSSRLPFVLAGDFNTPASSRELDHFRTGDLVRSCFTSEAVTHPATRRCLDYIFVDRRWRVQDARVIAEGPSDHWPLFAHLSWEETGTRG